MKRFAKRYISIALILAAMTASGCRDISTPERLRANTAPPPQTTRSVLAFESAADAEDDTDESDGVIITESDDTDENGVDTAAPEESEAPASSVFVTTSSETQAETTADLFAGTTADTPETTFPEQTAPLETPASVEIITAAEETAAAAPEETTQPPQTTQAQTTQAAQSASSGEKIYNVIGQNGILVTYENGHYRGVMPCFGTYTLAETWAANVSRFAEELPDVNVYNMVVPISSEFYTPDSYWKSGFTTKQLNKIEDIRKYLVGVTDVDAYSAVASHTSEPIYARTDHHWLPLGAYYAAQVFAGAAGADFPDISQYTAVQRAGYVGSMYTYSKDVHLYNDSETFTLYISPNADRISTTYYNNYFTGGYAGDLFVSRNASSFYCSFLGSDDLIAKIDTDVKNGRTLVIFKESFGNGLVPFLTSGFETIYVCDIRYFALDAVQFCKDVGADDLLFAVCTMTAAGGNGNYLKELLK